MNASNKTSRRHFLASSTAATTALAAGLVANPAAPDAVAKEGAVERGSASSTGETRARNRVGAVAYGYQYSIGLFSYKDRPGEKFDAVRFVEANHEAGGEVARAGEGPGLNPDRPQQRERARRKCGARLERQAPRDPS